MFVTPNFDKTPLFVQHFNNIIARVLSLRTWATSRLSETPLKLNILKCFMLTFPIYLFTYIIQKRYFLGGYPPLGPLKVKSPKARAQYIKNQLSYNHFKFEKNYLIFFWNFEKFFSLLLLLTEGGGSKILGNMLS